MDTCTLFCSRVFASSVSWKTLETIAPQHEWVHQDFWWQDFVYSKKINQYPWRKYYFKSGTENIQHESGISYRVRNEENTRNFVKGYTQEGLSWGTKILRISSHWNQKKLEQCTEHYSIKYTCWVTQAYKSQESGGILRPRVQDQFGIIPDHIPFSNS